MSANSTNVSSSFDWGDFTPWNERVTCVIVNVLCCSLGVGANGIAIGLTVFTDLSKNNVNILIAHLAACDFMFTSVFVVGQNLYVLFREKLPPVGCSWLAFVYFTAAMQEFIFPPLLAINRYIGLYYPDKYKKIYTNTNLALMVACTWVYGAGVPLTFTLSGKTGYDQKNEHCCIVVEDQVIWKMMYWAAVIAPLVGVCDTTMVVCNWKIYKLLKNHRTKQGAVLEKNVVNENREIMYFMVTDTIMAIVFHTLYHTCKFLITDRPTLATRLTFNALTLANAGFRGLMILSLLRPYRNAFKKHILSIEPNTVAPQRFGVSAGPTGKSGTAVPTRA